MVLDDVWGAGRRERHVRQSLEEIQCDFSQAQTAELLPGVRVVAVALVPI